MNKLFYFALGCFSLLFTLISLFGYHFWYLKIGFNNLQFWGQAGDFFGGILNPIFALSSFIALLYSINIQRQELSLTRTELKNSVVQQTKLAEEAGRQRAQTVNLEHYRYAQENLVQHFRKISDLLEHGLSDFAPQSEMLVFNNLSEIVNYTSFVISAPINLIVSESDSPADLLALEFLAAQKAIKNATSNYPGLREKIMFSAMNFNLEVRNMKVSCEAYYELCNSLEIDIRTNPITRLHHEKSALYLCYAYFLTNSLFEDQLQDRSIVPSLSRHPIWHELFLVALKNQKLPEHALAYFNE